MATMTSDLSAPSTPPEVRMDPEVMGGRPFFVGTRVPVAIVLASIDAGIEWSRIVAPYPFLTEAHVAAARAFAAEAPQLTLSEDEAAALLHLSPARVLGLVAGGHLACAEALPATPRRLTASSVLDYRSVSKARQAQGLEEMAAATGRLGLYDDELEVVPVRSKALSDTLAKVPNSRAQS